MRSAAIIVLGGLGMILGGVIVLELRGAAAPLSIADGPLSTRPRAATPGGAVPDPTATWVATILARPLFSPSRTPPVGPGAPAVAALPRLSGIMITPGRRDAVFTPAAGPPIIAVEGGRVGVFTVQSIGPDSVTVSGPHGVAVLHTTFDSGGARNDAPPPPPSPFSVIDGITGTPGGIWLDNGKADLPNAATWPGPPALSPLAPPPAAPAGSPLLAPPG